MPSIGPAIAGLNENNDDKTLPVWYNDAINSYLGGYARQFRPKENRAAAADWRTAYNNYYTQADANATADLYSDVTKGIIGDKNTYLGDYERLRSGNLESLGSVFKDVLDYGLASEKAKLAAGGYGNTGPSSYDKILSSTRTASNLTPVLNQIYGNLGREATASYGSRVDQNRYLIDLFRQDPLGGYAIQAANRSINPYLTQIGLAGAGISGLGSTTNQIKNNLSGYETVKGLTSRWSDIDKDIWSTLTGGLYGQAYGSQPGQDTATTMGLIGTAASIYGGSNQYRPPAQSGNPNAGAGTTWQSAYSNYNPNTSYVNQNPYGNYNYGMSYGGAPQGNDAQNAYYEQLLRSGGGGYASGLGVGY